MPVASPPATRPPTLPATRQTDASRRAKDTSWTSGFARVAPGLGLALAAAVLSVGVSARIPAVSALLLAIVLGIVVGNAGILPASTAPGLAVASRRLLRVGIVLLGLYVAPAQITALGGGVIAVAVAVVAGGFLVAEIAGRLLGVAPSQRILIGAGMSICGAAAVAAVEPPSGLRDTVPVGSRLPMTAGSAAKVLLAWAPDGVRAPLLDNSVFAERTLADVRKKGWAQSVAERAAGVASVSVPVRDADGEVVAAISVSGPIERIGRRPGARWAADLLAAATALQERLAHTPD